MLKGAGLGVKVVMVTGLGVVSASLLLQSFPSVP